jgi:hypothetical protein
MATTNDSDEDDNKINMIDSILSNIENSLVFFFSLPQFRNSF